MPPHLGLDDPLLLNEWFAVAWTSSLPENKLQAVRVLGEDLVLWRTGDGVRAWKDLCVHRGARLSLGRISPSENGPCVVCPYHGWEYNSAGECVRFPAHPEQTPPARAHLKCFAVQEKYGLVWVCLGKPAGKIPSFPEGETPGFRLISTGPYNYHAQGPRVIENILDLAHLPIAHAGLLGDPAECGDRRLYGHNLGGWNRGPRHSALATKPRWHRPFRQSPLHLRGRAPFTTRLTKSHPTQHFAILAPSRPSMRKAAWHGSCSQ